VKEERKGREGWIQPKEREEIERLFLKLKTLDDRE